MNFIGLNIIRLILYYCPCSRLLLKTANQVFLSAYCLFFKLDFKAWKHKNAAIVLYALIDHPSTKCHFMQWAISLAEKLNKAKQNMFIPTCFRSCIARTAKRSDFFPIAMKTMKFGCYNSADS